MNLLADSGLTCGGFLRVILVSSHTLDFFGWFGDLCFFFVVILFV